MNREQKRALTILISMSVAIVLAVTAVMMKMFHLRWLSVLLVLTVPVVACTGGIVYFRLRPHTGTVAFDERDQEIQRKASLVASGFGYVFLLLGSFAATFILGENASIPVASLPLIVAAAGVGYAYAFFVSLVIQYGRGGHDHE